MKKIFCLIGIIIPFLLAGNSFSRDYKSSHKLKAGDVISADVINEVFDVIQTSTRSILPTDIIGSWTCIESTNQGGGGSFPLENYGYTQEADGVMWSRSQVLTFSDNFDGTFSWSSENFHPFSSTELISSNGNYTVVDNMFVSSFINNSPANVYSKIRLVGTTRFVLPAINTESLLSIMCDKNNIPPESPTNQTITTDSNNVTLTWSDDSNDESEFIIMRRDKLTSGYVETGRVPANVNTYQETVLNSGTYWYRIEAENSHGHSNGSNVVKVVIP